MPNASSDHSGVEIDALHWLESGLPDVDSPHWTPFLIRAELGNTTSKPTASRVVERTDNARDPASAGVEP
jgi:hypothetical protein